MAVGTKKKKKKRKPAWACCFPARWCEAVWGGRASFGRRLLGLGARPRRLVGPASQALRGPPLRGRLGSRVVFLVARTACPRCLSPPPILAWGLFSRGANPATLPLAGEWSHRSCVRLPAPSPPPVLLRPSARRAALFPPLPARLGGARCSGCARRAGGVGRPAGAAG